MIIRVIDVETCGLLPDAGQIVEVATVDLVDGEGGWKRGKMWSSLVNPGRAIPPEASAVHHITDDMVKDAPRFEQLPPILEGADYRAAHNAKFDVGILAANGAQGLADKPWLCTYKCGVMLYPDAPNHKNQTLRYWLGLKLADPEAALPHRAMGDAYVTAALLRTFLRSATVEQMADATTRPVLLPRFTFGKHAMAPLKDVPLDYLSWIVGKGAEFDEDVLHTAKHYLAKGMS